MLDLASGNYNTPVVRLAALLAVCLLQAWLMWNFIMFQVTPISFNKALQLPQCWFFFLFRVNINMLQPSIHKFQCQWIEEFVAKY